MSQFKKFTLLSFVLLFVFSCSDETTYFDQEAEEAFKEKIDQNSVSVTDLTELNSVLNFDQAGVVDLVTSTTSTSGKSFSKAKGNELAGDYPLTLVATLDAPRPNFDGFDNLAATHVAINGDVAYVTYNTAGLGYAGAMYIIDIADPQNPVVLSGILYYADLNSVVYNEGHAYVVGGFDAGESLTNAFIGKIPVAGNTIDFNNITYGIQDGFNVPDVAIQNDKVIVGSGTNGLLIAYDKATMTKLYDTPVTDIRSLSVKDNTIAVLDASSGVKFMDPDFNLVNEIAISSDFGVDEKRTITHFGENVLVAEGSNGAGVYNAATGAFIEHLPILLDPDGIEAVNKVTNAVSVNEDVVFMANGGAGLALFKGTGSTADPYGVIDLAGSINYVASKGDYLFAAAGLGGFKVIKMNKPSSELQERCAVSPVYNGTNILNVNVGEDLSYSGSRSFRALTINGSLLLCGSWTVRNGIDIGSNALFELSGSMTLARNDRRRNITVGEGATFRIEDGNLTIWGDLILEDNASLEFIGTNSVTVHGSVIRSSSAAVSGNFDDTEGKF